MDYSQFRNMKRYAQLSEVYVTLAEEKNINYEMKKTDIQEIV